MGIKEPKLEIFQNKRVKILATNGKTYIGKVFLHTPAHDNDGEEALALDNGMWFDESDIKSIEIID